jgi:leader peptidase (prepilin peptidase) / N-methyltransferase
VELLIFGFVAGVSIGSFANACIYRIPRGIALTSPGSFCPDCSALLRWFELVPVLSYLSQGGRCRHCRTRISLSYPVVEVLHGVGVVLSLLVFDLTVNAAEVPLFASLLLTVALVDWRHFVIPNGLVVSGIILGIAVKAVSAPHTLIGSLGSSFAAFGVLFIIRLAGNHLFGRESMGLGDVKLAAVLGLFLGITGFLVALWIASVFGLLLATAKIRPALFSPGPAADHEIVMGSGLMDSSGNVMRVVPFGTYLACSAILVSYLQYPIDRMIDSWLSLMI